MIQLTRPAQPEAPLLVESVHPDDLASLQYRKQRTGELLVWYTCRQCGALAFVSLPRGTAARLCLHHEADCAAAPPG